MDLNPAAYYHRRKVFITGHTGFKGGWLAFWLQSAGAEVTGLALPARTREDFFYLSGLEQRVESIIGDIQERETLVKTIQESAPEIIFHLAAQPIVRRSYRQPAATFATNVMGTVNVLEAVRQTPSVRAVVVITSDKCYANEEWEYPYRENDRLGGRDPYSASKAAAEVVTAAYRSSFFSTGPLVATARAGNVIGGGDWQEDRLLPDCIRALMRGKTIHIRHPTAVRPWQHVLEPLAGYLELGKRLLENESTYAEAWNFGPDPEAFITVKELVERIITVWGAGGWQRDGQEGPHEAGLLMLDSTKARRQLQWHPRWSVGQAVQETVAWYRAAYEGQDMARFTLHQIERYLHAAS